MMFLSHGIEKKNDNFNILKQILTMKTIKKSKSYKTGEKYDQAHLPVVYMRLHFGGLENVIKIYKEMKNYDYVLIFEKPSSDLELQILDYTSSTTTSKIPSFTTLSMVQQQQQYTNLFFNVGIKNDFNFETVSYVYSVKLDVLQLRKELDKAIVILVDENESFPLRDQYYIILSNIEETFFEESNYNTLYLYVDANDNDINKLIKQFDLYYNYLINLNGKFKKDNRITMFENEILNKINDFITFKNDIITSENDFMMQLPIYRKRHLTNIEINRGNQNSTLIFNYIKPKLEKLFQHNNNGNGDDNNDNHKHHQREKEGNLNNCADCNNNKPKYREGTINGKYFCNEKCQLSYYNSLDNKKSS